MTDKEKTKDIELKLLEFTLRDLAQNLSVLRCEAIGYEADLLCLSKTAYLTEFEIKVSRSDFLNDHKKSKWNVYLDKTLQESKRHDGTPYMPNYFYYVYPKDMITLDEIPEQAGAIYLDVNYKGKWYFHILKRAPRLSKKKCSPKLMRKMIRSLSFKTLNLLKANDILKS